jgi:hypothetical protein
MKPLHAERLEQDRAVGVLVVPFLSWQCRPSSGLPLRCLAVTRTSRSRAADARLPSMVPISFDPYIRRLMGRPGRSLWGGWQG